MENSDRKDRDDESTSESYRKHLIEAYQDHSVSFAKAQMTLAGGALPVSIALVDNITGFSNPDHAYLLLASWICWSLALTSIVGAYFSGRQAAWKAIAQFDAGRLGGTEGEKPGGWIAILVNFLTLISLVLFVLGIFIFVAYIFLTMR
ncbi:hypothetical protein [Lentisalinibacter sediminis]|uniref:hypothetical protein n=1 Tax=Lentisalinibacter sediminis TaxID=2992237 RepID=UPI003867C501